MQKTMLGIFTDRGDVEEAIDTLRREGFNPKDISLVMKDDREAREIGDNTGADVAGGAISGATTGAVVGGIAGLLAGTVLPGLSGFLIAGPIGAALGLTGAAATTVSGAATGAVAGGLIGGLMSLGLTRDEASQYESRVNEGAILLAVPIAGRDEGMVRDIFDENNASEVKTVSQSDEGIRSTRSDRRYADDIEQDRPITHTHAHSHQYTSAGMKGGASRRGERDSDDPEIFDEEE